MRRTLWILSFLFLSLPLAACASDAKAPVGLTSRSEIDGRVRQTVALRVGDSPETQVATVLVQGKGTLTVSTDAPHVVADGDLVVVEESTLPAGSIVTSSRARLGAAVKPVREPPTATLTHPATAPAAPSSSCESGWCPIEAPAAAAPAPACVAAPLPTALSPLSARPCGTPVYIGCDGTPGGNRPTPGPTYKPMPPCDRAAGLTGPQKVAMAPVGLVACIVKGLVGTVECVLAGPGL